MDIASFLDILAECNIFDTEESNLTFLKVLGTIRLVVRILQIVVPIALIVWGTIDLGKSVISGDEKKVKENQGKFVKRIVAAVLVFLVPFLVSLIMKYLSGDEWSDCWEASKEYHIGTSNVVKDANEGYHEMKDIE